MLLLNGDTFHIIYQLFIIYFTGKYDNRANWYEYVVVFV